MICALREQVAFKDKRRIEPRRMQIYVLSMHAHCFFPRLHATRRDQVALKYKRKIELMVRKPDKDAEEVSLG